jgi:hypothetical protein
MKTQFDWKHRVVSLENLKAMCERVSGTVHTYRVTKVTRSRVHVDYSNPDEYGTPDPITAVYPCYPSVEQVAIVLDAVRYINDRDDYGYQAFDQLVDCVTLWRHADESGAEIWESHREIVARGIAHEGYRDTCVVCDLPKGGE